MPPAFFANLFNTYKSATNLTKIITRQCSRNLLGDKNLSLDGTTLLSRFMVYFDEIITKKTTYNTESTISEPVNVMENLKRDCSSTLKKLNIGQILGLFPQVNDRRYISNKNDFLKVLNILDLECCLRLKTLNFEDTLRLLNAYMLIVPNRITGYRFYQIAIDDIHDHMDYCSKEQLLQFVFFVALQKSTKKAKTILNKFLKSLDKEFLDSLAVEEIALICYVTYKTGTKIRNKVFLDRVTLILKDNLYLLKDPAMLTTFAKTIWHNHYQDEDLLSTISCAIFFNNVVKHYTFTGMCHILALYADYLYYDENLLKLFTEKCIEEMRNCKSNLKKQAYFAEQLRAKDITRFLWCISYLGYNEINEKDFNEVIVASIIERIKIGEYKKDMESLFDSVLYLWMMNYRPIELVRLVLTQENVAMIRDNPTKNKNRLGLLLTIIQLEDRKLFNSLHIAHCPAPQVADLSSHVHKRPALKRVFDIVKQMSINTEMNRIEMGYQIPHLNILGISGYRNKIYKAVNIEVLDGNVCVKNKDCHPSGFMQLKIRILEKQEESLIILSQRELEEMTNLELKDLVEDEIKLV